MSSTQVTILFPYGAVPLLATGLISRADGGLRVLATAVDSVLGDEDIEGLNRPLVIFGSFGRLPRPHAGPSRHRDTEETVSRLEGQPIGYIPRATSYLSYELGMPHPLDGGPDRMVLLKGPWSPEPSCDRIHRVARVPKRAATTGPVPSDHLPSMDVAPPQMILAYATGASIMRASGSLALSDRYSLHRRATVLLRGEHERFTRWLIVPHMHNELPLLATELVGELNE